MSVDDDFEQDGTESTTPEPNYFCVIPSYILFDNNLTPHARLLYGLLSSLCKSKGYCWASNSYFAEKFKVTRKIASKWLSELAKNNHICIELSQLSKRKIYLQIAKMGIPQKGEGHPSKRGTDNNIYKEPLRCSSDKLRLSSNTPSPKGTGVMGKPLDLIDNDNVLYAKKLYKALQSKRKIMSKVNLMSWISQLRKAKAEIGCERFRLVLDWYCEHLSDKYTPKAYSALSFVKKFYAIEDAMNRHSPAVLKTTVSEQAKQIAKDVWKEWQWPIKVKPQLEPILQVCLDNIKQFRKHQSKWLAEYEPKMIARHKSKKVYSYSTEDRIFLFAQHFDKYMSESSQFVRWWFQRIFEINGKRKNWDGDLTQYVFDVKHTIFTDWGRQLTMEWFENPKRWDDYIELLYGNKQL